MNRYFTGTKTVEELRKRYRELLKKHHPDNSGNEETMKEINRQYDDVFARISHENKSDGESTTYDDKAEDKALREVLQKIIHINADVEIVGSWLWVEKGSYEYRQLLKEVGFHYASRKRAWYWHSGEYHKRSKKEISLAEIRLKYGSEKVNSKSKQYALN